MSPITVHLMAYISKQKSSWKSHNYELINWVQWCIHRDLRNIYEALACNHLKIKFVLSRFWYLSMNRFYLQMEWVLFYGVSQVEPPFFYSSPEQTNQTLALRTSGTWPGAWTMKEVQHTQDMFSYQYSLWLTTAIKLNVIGFPM